MSSKNIAFVLVPGSFSPNTFYSKVIPRLYAEGYDAYPTPLLSAGERRISGPATMEEDAEFIHKRIEEVLDSGKDVILVMNSYGGFPGSESCQGLSKEEREKDEKQNGVVGLVYIASFLPPVGKNLTTMMGNDLPEFDNTPDSYNTLATDAYQNIFPEISESEGKSYLAQMPNHSAISLTGPLNYPAYLYIPSTVVIPKHDKIIPPESQRKGVERAKKEGAMITLKTVDAGHVPMLSVPDQIAEILIAAAKPSS